MGRGDGVSVLTVGDTFILDRSTPAIISVPATMLVCQKHT